MNQEIAYIRQAYKNTHVLTEHYCINFWSSASSSDATFCTAWYNRLQVVLYFIFIKNLLFLLQSVSWTAHPKYNTHSVATSNDFVAKIFLKVLLRTYSKDVIWDLFTWHWVLSTEYPADIMQRANSNHNTRGHTFKLLPSHCRVNVRKSFFAERVVKPWNCSLPAELHHFSSLSVFKSFVFSSTDLSDFVTCQFTVHCHWHVSGRFWPFVVNK